MKEFLLSKNGIVFVAYLGVVGYFLWAEHSPHHAYLPLLLVGACVLMHLFMHRDHGTI